MKAIFLSIIVACGTATANELRISLDPAQNVEAVRLSQRDAANPRIDVYSSFQIINREGTARFKATECLHLSYLQGAAPEIIQSRNEEGRITKNDKETLYRFPNRLKDVSRIEVSHKLDRSFVYVFAVSQTLRIEFRSGEEPTSKKINDEDVPVSDPALIVVVPNGDKAPHVKNTKKPNKAEMATPMKPSD